VPQERERPRLPLTAPGRRAGAPPAAGVLYVSHTGHVSGAERSLLDLLVALPPEVAPALACPEDGPLAGRARAAGVRTVGITGTAGSLRLGVRQTPRALAEMARTAFEVGREVDRLRPGLLHANSIRAGLVALPAGRVRRRPVVVHVRDRLPRGGAADTSIRLVARGAAAIVANSRYTAEGVTALVPGAAVTVVHNAVDLERFDPGRADREATRAALGIPREAFAVGVVGQITPWKGQLEAVEAVAGLAADRDVRLLLVGEAKFVDAATRFDNRAYVRRIEEAVARTGLGDRVALLGEREDVPAVLAALDTLLVPSWEEPFGRVVLEGMAMGVPVVATRVGGPAEVIADGRDGLLVAPREPAAWTAALRRLAGDPGLRDALARGGRRRAADFSPARHAEAVAAVYRRLGPWPPGRPAGPSSA
jgi:glycosyltransferase involved in cell wall biosynthesis